MLIRKRTVTVLFGTIVWMIFGLGPEANSATKARKQVFGKTARGETVELYTLRNSKGMEATIMTYGGIIVSLVALTVSVPLAIATAIFYVLYRFLEDYLLIPRVMARTVAVPSPGLVVPPVTHTGRP